MATSRDFNDMLNEHLDYDLMASEYMSRDWLISNVERDDEWKGGTIPVPFKGAQASSISFGGLTDASLIGKSRFVRGTIESYKEMWGALKFNHTDLIQHDGKVDEDSFLKILPDEMEDFTQFMKERGSCVMLNGFASLAAGNGAADGTIAVRHPERFVLDELVYVDDNDSVVSAGGYIRTIDKNTGVITLYDAPVTGGSVIDLSAYTLAAVAKVYYNGTQPGTDLGFTSVRSQLLSAVNGGSTNLFGKAKTAWPYLQALQLDGSTFTQANILEGLFNKFSLAKQRCANKPTKAVMSFKNGSAVLKCLEVNKGAYNIVQGSRKVSAYGWEEVTIGGPKGLLTVVMVLEMEDDIIWFKSDKGFKFHSNGFFRTRTNPDGRKYHEVRATTGYSYIVDMMLFGELACYMPEANAIVHSVDFELSES
jgi:hypothetical protein